jgi:hypothetical protein
MFLVFIDSTPSCRERLAHCVGLLPHLLILNIPLCEGRTLYWCQSQYGGTGHDRKNQHDRPLLTVLRRRLGPGIMALTKTRLGLAPSIYYVSDGPPFGVFTPLQVIPVCRELPFLQARLDCWRTAHLQVLCPETNRERKLPL